MEKIQDSQKMYFEEKSTFLDNIFERQFRLAKETLNTWVLTAFLNELKNVYCLKRNEILNKLNGKKSNQEILNIILEYF